MRISLLARAIRAFLRGAPLGDVVLMKLAALSPASPAIEAAIEKAPAWPGVPPIWRLRKLARGTFGREYARFLDDNRIAPLEVCDATKEAVEASPYAVRFTRTHDMHHVLTGFDTSLAGEIGVLAFNVAQGSAPVSRTMLLFVSVLYSLVSPFRADEIWRNRRAGLALGAQALPVITEPIEEYLSEPLDAVRAKLKLA